MSKRQREGKKERRKEGGREGGRGEKRKKGKEGGPKRETKKQREWGGGNGQNAVNLTLKRSDISIRPHKITYQNSRDQRCGYSYCS